MPQWENTPETPADTAVFRIVRTPATGKLAGLLTCNDLVGCNTHFAMNRTVPCEGRDRCPLCADGHAYRWHGWVSAVILPGLEHVLVEFTANAATTFHTYQDLHGSLRACRFSAFRPSGRHNGRVVIQTTPGDPGKIRLPDPPNIRRILCHIWNVQYTDEQPTRMTRPPFKNVNVDDNGSDGRYRADQ